MRVERRAAVRGMAAARARSAVEASWLHWCLLAAEGWQVAAHVRAAGERRRRRGLAVAWTSWWRFKAEGDLHGSQQRVAASAIATRRLRPRMTAWCAATARRREAARLYNRLLVEADERGDGETAGEARHELSWLTEDSEAPVADTIIWSRLKR